MYNLRYFYKRRFYRLAPALAVVLSISAIANFLLGPIGDHQRIARQGIASLFLLGNVGAYQDSGDYFSPNPNPLIHTWSLSVEEQIYIFLPLFLVLILHNRNNLKKSLIVALSSIGLISLFSFLFPTILQPLYSRAGIETASQFSFYSPIERIWQFALGGIAFFMLERYKNRGKRIPKGVHLLIAITLVMLLFGSIHMNPRVSSLLASLFAVVVILTKSIDVLPYPFIKKLKWVGDRSYSIYLVHMPLLYIAKHSPITQNAIGDSQLIKSSIAVVASISLGALSYSKAENKFRNTGKSEHLSLQTILVSLLLTFLIPLATFLSLNRSTEFGLKNSGLPVPNIISPWNWDKDCKFLSTSSYVESNTCKYGKHDSGKSILLIGDSHAASISRAIISLGDSNNLGTYVKTFPGCSFVLSNRDFEPFYSYEYLTTECLEHNKSILNFVKSKKPTVIIYMQRSSSVMVSPNNTRSRNLYKEMVSKNLEVLMKERVSIIHIGSTPELLPITTRIQDLLNRTNRFSKIPFEDNFFWKRNKVTNYYVDTLGIYCPGKICRNNSPQGWLFHDADHLSEIGANKLILELDPLIKKILNK